MSSTITTESHPDLLEDLRIIADESPGKGLAFQRLVKLAGITQTELARKAGLDRSTVSHWIAERIWPSAEKMLECLRLLEIDEARLIQILGDQVRQEKLRELLSVSLSGQSAQITMGDLVKELDKQDIGDAKTRELIVLRALREPVLKAMGIKALSDTKAAALILERLDEAEQNASKFKLKVMHKPIDPIMRLGEDRERLLEAMDPEARREWHKKHNIPYGEGEEE